MAKSTLVIEMEVSEMLELRKLAGALHHIVETCPTLLKKFSRLSMCSRDSYDLCLQMEEEFDRISTEARNILSTITSYSKKEAEGYLIKEGE